MEMQFLIAMLAFITAIASYINYRYIKLPKTIGLTIITLALSLLIMSLISIGQQWVQPISDFLSSVNFSSTVMDGMLSFLLFAGALHINAVELSQHKKVVAALATASVLISCVLIGYVIWYITGLVGFQLDLIYCLLFGALIAPTDPIGVIGVMKRTNTPHVIRLKITGESLFNDAVGIFLFVLLLQVAHGQHDKLSYSKMALHLVQEGFGGILLGYLSGVVTAYFLRRVNHEETAIIMTLALVTGCYSLAAIVRVSGPIATVVAGLVIGTQCNRPHFSSGVAKRLYGFWDLIDDILNSFLFAMIGLEVLSIHADPIALMLGLAGFFIVIVIRFLSVIIPELVLEPWRSFNFRTILLMTWGGMRGGLSIALALSIPESSSKDLILTITYVVVVLSIILQGLSLEPMIKRLFPTTKQRQAKAIEQHKAQATDCN